MFSLIPGVGLQPKTPELSITQFTIPAGAGATFSVSNNIATFTTNAAHGLTMNVTGATPPNYFVMFGGSTSGLTGTGILVGNIFRILAIPSTTTFTFYTTITAATVTSTTVFPVFFPNFLAGPSKISNASQPTQTISSVVTPFPFPILGQSAYNITTGANCAVQYNPDATAVPLDQYTTPAAGTPATAPTWRTKIAASSQGWSIGAYPWEMVIANGSTATTSISVIDG